MSKNIPVILAGGSGTRLWPASRQSFPKQFLATQPGGRTLLQQCLLRAQAVIPNASAPIIVCLEQHRFIVAAQCEEIGIKPQIILLEPEGRNTAPSVALALAYLTQHQIDDANVWVLSADHAMDESDLLKRSFAAAHQAAQLNHITVFGVEATRPETGYGYIEKDAQHSPISDDVYVVKQFVEKPTFEVAQQFCQDPNYYYNSGMFVFPEALLLAAFSEYAPAIWQQTQQAVTDAIADGVFLHIDKPAFLAIEPDSIDYAIIEHVNNLAMVPLRSHWTDLGAWDKWAEQYQTDEKQNATFGRVVMEDCNGTYIQANSKVIAGLGLNDMVVVETPDAILISKKSEVQKVKQAVNAMKEKGYTEAKQNPLVYRPWGSFESILLEDNYQVKRLILTPGQWISLQRHQHRCEHWVVVAGKAEITIDDSIKEYGPNQSVYIPKGAKHQLKNIGDTPLVVIEVQTGDYLGEDDIERFDDKYGRS